MLHKPAIKWLELLQLFPALLHFGSQKLLHFLPCTLVQYERQFNEPGFSSSIA